jgi:hypothetical protein
MWKQACIIIAILLVFVGCATPPPTETPFPHPYRTNLVVDVYKSGFTNIGSVYIERQFSEHEQEIGTYAYNFINSLVGSKYEPDLTKYYWTTNLPPNILGVAPTDHDCNDGKVILINKNIWPQRRPDGVFDIYKFHEFGITIVHEWLHYYHHLEHPQVQMLCDWPAGYALKEMLGTNTLDLIRQ